MTAAKGGLPVTAATAHSHAVKLKQERPELYRLMAETALELKRNGERVSIARVFEAVRCNGGFKAVDGEPFKLNNTLAPALARLLSRDFPELSGAFELRKSLSDGWEGEANG